VKNDTIFGKIKINFAGCSITVKQDTINRMYLEDIKVVTILNESRDTYYTYSIGDKNTFFKAVILEKTLY